MCVCVEQFLTKASLIWEETSIEKTPPSDWPVGESMGAFLFVNVNTAWKVQATAIETLTQTTYLFFFLKKVF